MLINVAFLCAGARSEWSMAMKLLDCSWSSHILTPMRTATEPGTGVWATATIRQVISSRSSVWASQILVLILHNQLSPFPKLQFFFFSTHVKSHWPLSRKFLNTIGRYKYADLYVLKEDSSGIFCLFDCISFCPVDSQPDTQEVDRSEIRTQILLATASSALKSRHSFTHMLTEVWPRKKHGKISALVQLVLF